MLFGDIPYSEAWHIDEIKEPKFDTQKEVLYALEELLDEALDQIDESDPNTISKYDLYYGRDMTKWRKLAKSIKLKIYMYLSNKEDVGAEIKALIEEGDLLSSSADDCKFPFYDSPGNRNPNAEFDNQNPDLLGWMYFGTPEIVDPMNATNDPRRPIYFYPNKEGLYVGIASTHEGSAMEAEDPSEITEARFNLDNLFKSDYPDVICSYPEVMSAAWASPKTSPKPTNISRRVWKHPAPTSESLRPMPRPSPTEFPPSRRWAATKKRSKPLPHSSVSR